MQRMELSGIIPHGRCIPHYTELTAFQNEKAEVIYPRFRTKYQSNDLGNQTIILNQNAR